MLDYAITFQSFRNTTLFMFLFVAEFSLYLTKFTDRKITTQSL